MLDVCLLGCGGSMPVPYRYLTSLIAGCKGSKVLIDCGEGTQVSMKILGTGFKNIAAICFTHYHADHVAGFPGILLTIANSGRIEPLTIIGPEGLKEIVKGMRVIAPMLPYELRLIEITDREEQIISVEDIYIHTLLVEHTLPCAAYSIEIKRARRFDAEKANRNNVPKVLWNKLQKLKGTEEYKGTIFTSDMVLGDERKGIKLCYCTDSRPKYELIDFIREADLFVCEGMYGDNEDLVKALENKHMLFSEAALLARDGNVKELWLTHYSPALLEPIKYLDNSKNIFNNTILGEDRMCKTLMFEK